jgi:hypothetical protein
MATIAIALILAVGPLLIATRPVESHPLHTSLAQIEYDPVKREMQISIRVFVDDFSKASAAYALLNRGKTSGASALAYARSAFMVADPSGRQLPLAYCGGQRVADLIWLCFHTSAPRGISRFQVADKILFDLYTDQINIVQATYGGKKVSLLFTHGEGFKRLE